MKKIIVISILILFCICPVWGNEYIEKDIGYIKVNIKNNYLNLRSEPDEKSEIIAKLPKGMYLNYSSDFQKNGSR